MREETQPYTCVFCKQPITLPQLPAAQLEDGRLLHVECWDAYREAQRQQKN